MRGLVGFGGRIGRGRFVALLGATTAAFVLVGGAVAGLWLGGQPGPVRTWAAVAAQPVTVFLGLVLWSAVCRRCRDAGWSPWCCLLLLVPPASTILVLVLALRPSRRTAGAEADGARA